MAVTWTRAWWRWTGGPATRPVERVVRVDGRSRADEPGDERQAFGRWVRKRPRVDGGKRRGDGCGRRSLSPTWVLAVGGPQPAGRGGRVGGVGRDASRLAGLQRRLQGIAGGLAVYDEAPDNVSSSTYSSTPSLPGCRVAPGRRADAGLPLARVTSNRIDVEALAAMDGVGRFREVLPMLVDPVAFAGKLVDGAAGGRREPSRGMERHRDAMRSCGVASDARVRPVFAMKAFTTPKKDGRTSRLVLDARPLNDAMYGPICRTSATSSTRSSGIVLPCSVTRHRLDPSWAERWVDGGGMTAVLSGRATARQFAEVFGGAVWATDILAIPRCHFAALLPFAGRLGGRMGDAAAHSWDEVIDVPPSTRRELGALRKIVRENPWVVGGVPEDTGSVLWTDASSRAWAALLEAEGRFVDGRQGVFAGPDADAHINLKEMLAFAEGVVRLCWAPGAQRCRIDNAAVVGAVAKGSSSSYAANRVLSRSLRVAERRRIVLCPGWVPSGEQQADPYTREASLPRFPAPLSASR
ncbi:hypothetical protein DIPPA_15823 [Diplonema papillatum]|nr:hypothetical protein DIPPA_15823 [Diplonema papillatum]